MDRLKRWFGVQDERQAGKVPVWQPEAGSAPQFSTDDVQRRQQTVTMHDAQTHGRQQSQVGQLPQISENAKVTESGVEQMMEPVREKIMQVVPLKEGDCLSCKLIGTGVCWGASLFAALSYRKMAAQYTGFRRKFFAAYIVSFVMGLTLLGTARLFDMSIFQKPDEGGQRKGLQELIQEDMDNLHKLIDRFSQTSSSSTVQTEASGKRD